MTLANRINGALRRGPAWPIYAIGAGYGGWLFWQAATGALGVEPINALIRAYGLLSLQLLVAGLVVTPLRKLTGVSLLKFRRAIGVTAFSFALAHLLVWAILDLQDLARIGADLVKRPYITIGFAGFLMLLALAVTSNNTSIRRMGPGRWRKLHLLTYPAAVLGALHFIWLVKGYPVEPFAYAAAVLGLLALRPLLRDGAARAPRKGPAPVAGVTR